MVMATISTTINIRATTAPIAVVLLAESLPSLPSVLKEVLYIVGVGLPSVGKSSGGIASLD